METFFNREGVGKNEIRKKKDLECVLCLFKKRTSPMILEDRVWNYLLRVIKAVRVKVEGGGTP